MTPHSRKSTANSPYNGIQVGILANICLASLGLDPALPYCTSGGRGGVYSCTSRCPHAIQCTGLR